MENYDFGPLAIPYSNRKCNFKQRLGSCVATYASINEPPPKATFLSRLRFGGSAFVSEEISTLLWAKQHSGPSFPTVVLCFFSDLRSSKRLKVDDKRSRGPTALDCWHLLKQSVAGPITNHIITCDSYMFLHCLLAYSWTGIARQFLTFPTFPTWK